MDISDLPSEATGLIMAVVFPLVVEAGYRFHRVFMRITRSKDRDAGGAGYIVSATLGLLGLLIGFTFAMSADRYETRRVLVIQEANAISTAWQRQQLLEEPYRARLEVLMRKYIEERQLFAAAGTDEKTLDAVWERTDAIQQRIWRETQDALKPRAEITLTTLLIGATNDMFNVASTRRAAVDSQVPSVILWTLIVFALTSAGIIGYGLASGGSRHLVASTGLFLLVALAITLIVDLEQPRTGAIRISQKPMDRVAARILKPPVPAPRKPNIHTPRTATR